MRVIIQYHAQIRQAIGVAEESVDLAESATLADLIRTIADRHANVRPLILSDGRPSRSLLYFLGDAPIHEDDRLLDGAIVTILAPMAGGQQ